MTLWEYWEEYERTGKKEDLKAVVTRAHEMCHDGLITAQDLSVHLDRLKTEVRKRDDISNLYRFLYTDFKCYRRVRV